MFLALVLGTAQAAEVSIMTSFQGPEYAWLQDVISRYNASQKQDQVRSLLTGFDALKPKLLEAKNGKSADLVGPLPHDQLGELVAAGVLESLDSYTPGKNTLKVALRGFSYQGKLYGLPLAAESVAVLYNTKMLPTFPTNWADFIGVAQKYTDPEKKTYGFLADLGNAYMQYGLFSAYGGYVFGEKQGKLDVQDLGIANAGSARALSLIGDLKFKYGLIPEGMNPGDAKKAFLRGDVAMYLTGPWDLGDIKTARIPIGIASLPKPPQASAEWSPLVGVQGVVMNRYSPNKAAAARFVQFLTSPENQVALNKAGGRIPVSKKAINALRGDNVVVGFSKTITSGTAMPNVPQMGIVWGPWNAALDQATKKTGADAGALLSSAAKEIRLNLK